MSMTAAAAGHHVAVVVAGAVRRGGAGISLTVHGDFTMTGAKAATGDCVAADDAAGNPAIRSDSSR
jgi:hypothetical protein